MYRNTKTECGDFRQYEKFCSFCKQTGESEKVYSSHFVRESRDTNSKVTCPKLLAMECRYCHQSGHTLKYCPIRIHNQEHKHQYHQHRRYERSYQENMYKRKFHQHQHKAFSSPKKVVPDTKSSASFPTLPNYTPPVTKMTPRKNFVPSGKDSWTMKCPGAPKKDVSSKPVINKKSAAPVMVLFDDVSSKTEKKIKVTTSSPVNVVSIPSTTIDTKVASEINKKMKLLEAKQVIHIFKITQLEKHLSAQKKKIQEEVSSSETLREKVKEAEQKAFTMAEKMKIMEEEMKTMTSKMELLEEKVRIVEEQVTLDEIKESVKECDEMSWGDMVNEKSKETFDEYDDRWGGDVDENEHYCDDHFHDEYDDSRFDEPLY